MTDLQYGLGIVAFLSTAWLFSEDRRCVPWPMVVNGMALWFRFGTAGLYCSLLGKHFPVLNEGWRRHPFIGQSTHFDEFAIFVAIS